MRNAVKRITTNKRKPAYTVRYYDGRESGRFDSASFDEMAASADVCISFVFYSDPIGAHYFEFHRYLDEYIGYNVWNDGKVVHFDSPAELLGKYGDLYFFMICIYDD